MTKSNKTKIKERQKFSADKPIKKTLPEGAVVKHDLKKAPKVNEWRNMRPEVLEDKCIGCGTCVGVCPEATIEMSLVTSHQSSVRSKAKIDLEWCKGCGVCAAVCPIKAIIMKKER